MMRHLNLVLGLMGALALATGACTSSGGGDEQQDAGGNDAFHQFDAQHDVGQDDAGITCTGTGYTASIHQAEASADYLFYGGYTADPEGTSPWDRVSIELYYLLGGAEPLMAPGSVQLAATSADKNYATCTTCVRLVKSCTTGSGCSKTYLATGGTLTITELANDGNFAGTMTNVTLQEVTIATDGSYTSTPVPYGAWWCLDSYAFNTALTGTLPCGSGYVNCPASLPLCDTDYNTCVECVTNTDCASKPAGQQICGGGLCGACASMLDCTTGAPVCQANADTGKPECAAGPVCTGTDADGEPGDDGTAGARVLQTGVATNGSICFADPNADDYSDEYDFYKLTTTAAGNVTISVTWTDSSTDLDFTVLDSTLAEVDSAVTETNPETLTFAATATTTYYVAVYAYTAPSTITYSITATIP